MTRYDQPEARAAGDDIADRLADVAINAADKLGRVAAHVETTRDELIAQGTQFSSNVQKVGKNFSKALDKSLDEQPLTTVALAAAAGFVIGAIWKS